jgi:hypothetical protein
LAVRTRPLARVITAAGATAVTLHTVGAGRTLIVKEALIYNNSAGSRQVWLATRVDGVATRTYHFSRTLAAGADARVELWTVLDPGDVLELVSTGDQMHVTVSGTLLEGAPS